MINVVNIPVSFDSSMFFLFFSFLVLVVEALYHPSPPPLSQGKDGHFEGRSETRPQHHVGCVDYLEKREKG